MRCGGFTTYRRTTLKTIEGKYTLFAGAGAAAGILLQPFVSGLLRLPEVFYIIGPGLIFALLVTIAAMSLQYGDVPKSRHKKRFVLGALMLTGGMPVALLAGVASLNMIDRIVPGDKFELGGIGLPFFLGEIMSCAVWSLVLFTWTILTNRVKAFHIMRVALLVTIAIMLFANLIEIISKILWQKSFLLPMISITEEIGSAIVLAIGCAGYFSRPRKNVVEV
jgi:hypothetical protein